MLRSAVGPLGTSQVREAVQVRKSGEDFNWLVVGNMIFIFPYTGNNDPNRLSYFSEGLKPPTSYDLGIFILCILYVIFHQKKWFGQAVPNKISMSQPKQTVGSSISCCGLLQVLKATEALLEQLTTADPQDLEADLLLLGSPSRSISMTSGCIQMSLSGPTST